jgi:hypothetical protein
MDNFKGLTVPCHLRPPAQAVNWVELTEDSEVDARMRAQVATALGLIGEVLEGLAAKIAANRLEQDVSSPAVSVGIDTPPPTQTHTRAFFAAPSALRCALVSAAAPRLLGAPI